MAHFSKIIFMVGAIFSLRSFSNKGLSLSGPAALSGFRFLRSFKSPLREISISGMAGTVFG